MMKRNLFLIGLTVLAMIASCANQTQETTTQAPFGAQRPKLVALSDGNFGDLSCAQDLQFEAEPTTDQVQKAFQGCIVSSSKAKRTSLGRGLYTSLSWYIYPPFYYSQQYYSNPTYNNYNYGCVLFFGNQAANWSFNCISYIGGYGNSYVGNSYNNYCSSSCVYSFDPYCYQRCGY